MADIDFQNGFINGFVAGSTNIEVDMVNRRDTEANWISANPIIANGEQIIVDMPDESIKIKIGDGVKYFNELEYIDKPITEALDQKANTEDVLTQVEIETIAKKYADEAAKAAKDDLTQHNSEAIEALAQLSTEIDNNEGAIAALNNVAINKADKIHSHEMSDINGLSATLSEKVNRTEIPSYIPNSISAEGGPHISEVGTPTVSNRTEGNQVIFTFDYLKGEQGIQGIQGVQGPEGPKGDPGTSATHSWDGSVLTVSSASGITSANLLGPQGPEGPKGDTGVSISTIKQTVTSTADDGNNEITIEFTDGRTPVKFYVQNGSKGGNGTNGTRGSLWYSGTAVTGTNTSGQIFSGTGITSALINDYYLNTSTGYVYKCNLGGNASTATWVYMGNIKGTTGVGISSITNLYYTKANTTAPSAPTSVITTSSSSTHNAWNKTMPTYSASYPYYFICIQTYYTNGTYSWTTPVLAGALTSANQTANSASTKVNSLATVATSGKYSDLLETPTIPTKTSELTNDSGFKTTDNNTTYTLTKSGKSIILTGSDGSTTSVYDNAMSQYTSSDNKDYPLLMAYHVNTDTTSYTTYSYKNAQIYANPSTGAITANTFKFGDNCNLVYDTTNKCVSFQFL